MNEDARIAIATLGLAPHPEGGFFRETFRAPSLVSTPQGERAASTAIYFLLPAGTFSALHRVRSDESWHHYDGDPIALHTIGDDGIHAVVRLGRDLATGERPQHVVRAGVWQAAVPLGAPGAPGVGYALCGCIVAPGFDFADFEMPGREELTRLFPALRAVIQQLTRV
jgi:predicted cupin superfamily sugar epimerase